jgi:hypothetical protein
MRDPRLSVCLFVCLSVRVPQPYMIQWPCGAFQNNISKLRPVIFTSLLLIFAHAPVDEQRWCATCGPSNVALVSRGADDRTLPCWSHYCFRKGTPAQTKHRVHTKTSMQRCQEDPISGLRIDNGVLPFIITSCLAMTYRFAAALDRRFRWDGSSFLLSNRISSYQSAVAVQTLRSTILCWLRDGGESSRLAQVLVTYFIFRNVRYHYRKQATTGGLPRLGLFTLSFLPLADGHGE